ncbi:MAG TPA: FtsQ-type POTRA domain-containing protein [Nocardioidaceae bacterium]|jgi:cell division protein FtsQ|nr:FtsQ-type POTRA domain-containing protein [Nocardioidaceae bacterium]
MSLFTRSGPGVTRDKPDDPEKTVRTARRRFMRRQWSRRWLAWQRLVVAVLLMSLVGGGVWLVFFSSVLAVSGAQVVGTRLLTPAAVRRAAAVPTGSPLATADLSAISARVRRLVEVRSVDVSRAWPDEVRIDVVERRAVAVVEPVQGGRLRGIDATGVAFRSYDRRPPGLPVIRRAADAGTDALAEAATVAGSLPRPLAEKVAYVEVQTLDQISLELRAGPTVLWGSAADSVDKARVLAALIHQHARYYDVSVAGQPVIRK